MIATYPIHPKIRLVRNYIYYPYENVIIALWEERK
jgi:hypothetical protein